MRWAVVSTETLSHTKASLCEDRRTVCYPQLNLPVQYILQSSQNPHLRTRRVEGHNCLSATTEPAEQLVECTYITVRHPEKWVMQFSSNMKERCGFFLFLLGERVRGVRLCAWTWQTVSLFPVMKGLSQMCERMAKIVGFVTPRNQKYLCEAWISTKKK